MHLLKTNNRMIVTMIVSKTRSQQERRRKSQKRTNKLPTMKRSHLLLIKSTAPESQTTRNKMTMTVMMKSLIRMSPTEMTNRTKTPRKRTSARSDAEKGRRKRRTSKEWIPCTIQVKTSA